MKKWTVMLIPHDRGGTRTLSLSSLHLWLLVAALVCLTFSTAFLFQWNRSVLAASKVVHTQNRMLEARMASRPAVAVEKSEVNEDEVRAAEKRLRAEYEASLDAIVSELGELYDMETQVREITDFEPRPVKAAHGLAENGGGKGGPPAGLLAEDFTGIGNTTRPPAVIYGMARPSADLILQEIDLRTLSLRGLIESLLAEKDRVERIPALWPLAGGVGKRTSPFGLRRDPFTGRVRQHNGSDISARRGTRVLATAKGVVTESYYDRWFGNLIKIDHGNGYQTWYAHLTKRHLEAGVAVERGAVIGTLGSTGRSTGSHLHYEVHVAGKPRNAEKYLH